MSGWAAARLPVVAAPMAGGPTTPGLVAAVERAAGVGILAAGYLSPDALRSQIRQARALGADRFGVNLFVPRQVPTPDLAEFRARLIRFAGERTSLAGVEPGAPAWDDDAYEAKLAVVVEERVPLASTTFGLPSTADVARLHDAGVTVVATVTTPDEALAARAVGCDLLTVQGPAAGGHRGTHDVLAAPDRRPLAALLAGCASAGLPMIAAGGIATAADVRAALGAGAVAAQCGTAFLLADEAGTSVVHRAALAAGGRETVVTRAFSGRWARGLRNAWTDALSAEAPAAYPELNRLTSPLRKAAARAEDPEAVHLWAGERYREARALPAAEIVAALTPFPNAP